MGNDYSVSVAMCTYNGEKYIGQQLNSIINQSIRVDEIIICDDGSSDNTILIAETVLQNAGIEYKIIENENNLGVTKNFEKAISLCNGELIFLCDQDDVWRSDKVQKSLEVFNENSCTNLVFTDASVIDENESIIYSSLNKKNGVLQGEYSKYKLIDDFVRLNYNFYGCTMVIKKSFAMQIMPFYNTKMNHDAWIMSCAVLSGCFEYIPDQLLEYRIHGNNVASSNCDEKWTQILEQQTEFERHFSMQEHRKIKIALLQEAINRNLQSDAEIKNEYKDAIELYNLLETIESKRSIRSKFRLLKSCFNKEYKYRFCNRGESVTTVKKIKQLVCDIIYI